LSTYIGQIDVPRSARLAVFNLNDTVVKSTDWCLAMVEGGLRQLGVPGRAEDGALWGLIDNIYRTPSPNNLPNVLRAAQSSGYLAGVLPPKLVTAHDAFMAEVIAGTKSVEVPVEEFPGARALLDRLLVLGITPTVFSALNHDAGIHLLERSGLAALISRPLFVGGTGLTKVVATGWLRVLALHGAVPSSAVAFESKAVAAEGAIAAGYPLAIVHAPPPASPLDPRIVFVESWDAVR